MQTSLPSDSQKIHALFQKTVCFLLTSLFLLTLFSCSPNRIEKRTSSEQNFPENARVMQLTQAMDDMSAPAPMKSARFNAPVEQVSVKKRMVHYNGYAKMRSPKPEDLIEKARTIAVESGGYVEHIRTGNAVFRVPVNEFHAVFKKILTLGDVLSKNMSAQDVTDAFTDVDLKIKIATATRDRYLELLSRTENEEEKILLLKEIARLNESIEMLQNRLKTISTLADFSRINLDVTGIEPVSQERNKSDIFEFKWIHELSPFSRANLENSKKLEFEVPGDMVALGGKTWITESADGVTFSACRRINSPMGDTAFWISTVKERLEKGFRSTTEKKIGDFSCIRMESLSDKPYTYILGLNVYKNDLHIFEVYYPDQDLEKKYEAAIEEAVTKGVK